MTFPETAGETTRAAGVAGPTRRAASPSLRLLAITAVVHRASLPNDSSAMPELGWLRDEAARAKIEPAQWHSSVRKALRRPAPSDAPLVALRDMIGLSTVETLAVSLAAGVDEDLMLGRALARLQAPVGGSRPTVGLLASALDAAAPRDERAIHLLATGPAVSSGLLSLLGDGAPLPERSVAVPLHLCLALAGRDGVCPGTTIGMRPGAEVRLPPSILRDAERHAGGLAEGRRVLVLRTSSAAEGWSVAAAVAQALGRRAVFIDAGVHGAVGLGPWLLLRALLPVFCIDLGPGDRKALPAIPLYDGPSVVLCGPDGTVDPGHAAAVTWALPVPARAEREALWVQALSEGVSIDRSLGGETMPESQPELTLLAAELARVHRHGSGRIAHLGRLVRHRTALQGEHAVSAAAVAAASWTIEGGGLDALAQPMDDTVPDAALVMPAALRDEMHALLLRCRARDGLADGLGASAVTRYRPGVRAMFVGPSGTGKTLAAAWLATRLGIPLYRVDLASVTSKYIGETEKNLAQLLARAEQAEVVLLFDEADSLFGKRTDVKDSNDRFANAQTNYLLQRIETFEGIALLTSNSRARFDSAFARRLDAIIDFPLPGPEERRALWQSHLGNAHGLALRDVNLLAARADVAGGHIRNAVLAAAVLAHEAGRPIAAVDVVAGLAGEYGKLGRQLPVELLALA